MFRLGSPPRAGVRNSITRPAVGDRQASIGMGFRRYARMRMSLIAACRRGDGGNTGQLCSFRIGGRPGLDGAERTYFRREREAKGRPAQIPRSDVKLLRGLSIRPEVGFGSA